MEKKYAFLFICIPVRLLIAYISTILDKDSLKTAGYVSFLPALGFLTIYLFQLRDKWWNNLRPIHSINFLLFGLYAIKKKKIASLFLFIDVLIGLIFSILNYFFKFKF